jgi:hypothetical protein
LQAPTIIGGVVLLGAAGNEIARYSTTVSILVLMATIAVVLFWVGANFERRRRRRQAARIPADAVPSDAPRVGV